MTTTSRQRQQLPRKMLLGTGQKAELIQLPMLHRREQLLNSPKIRRRGETPASQTAERAILPGSTLSRSPQNETNAAPQSQTAAPQHPQRDTGLLLDGGDQFLSTSDIASVRIYDQRAAEAGDGRGALRMGMTFDPVFLARLRLRGVGADAAQAIAWYHRASALGNYEAELLEREVDTFTRGTGSASGSTTR